MARDPKLPDYSYARRGRPAIDPALRRIAIMAGAVSVLVIVVALVWGGLRPRLGFGGAPVEIVAPDVPLRIAPASPGGLTVPEADQQIMSGASSSTTEQLAPPPPPADLSQLQQAAAAPVAPAKPPAAASAVSGLATHPPAPATAPAPLPPPTAPAAAAGPARVQLAATSTEAAAHAYWADLAHKLPDLLASRTPIFIPATVNGKSVWRLRINGFADTAAARDFCAALAAKGAACTVAAF